MEAYARGFWLPKAGNRPSEYEDAVLPRAKLGSTRLIRSSLRYAIADGATETAFSGLWARQLVAAFVRGRLNAPPSPAQLNLIRGNWAERVTRKPLPWYLDAAVARGAFAALLGLELRYDTKDGSTHGTWTAFAAGDCCLVQIRRDAVIASFPFSRADEFNSRPDGLLGSTVAQGCKVETPPIRDGDWNTEDTFFLMSDAIGLWFLREYESGNSPWDALRDIDLPGNPDFQTFVNQLRQNGGLKNDDVTVLRIDVG